VISRAGGSSAANWRRLRNIAGGSAGNFVEWFDWFVYASFAIYFAESFFPDGSRTAQLMNAAFVFAGGFLARPVGALLMGMYADKAGRRAALTLSVAMMCSGSLLIALAPTGIDLVSPGLLIIARLLQGLSVGGEYGASATYVSEMAAERHRGFWSGCLYMTLIAGQLAALLVQVFLQTILSDSQLHVWGWRIPFALGAALAVVVCWMRRGIEETRSFAGQKANKEGRGGGYLVFTRYPRETAIVVALTGGGGIAFYTYTVYMQKLLINSGGMGTATAARIMALVLVTFMLLQPIAGWISDKIGRKATLSASFGSGALLAVPVLTLAASQPGLGVLVTYFLCLAPLLALSGYTALSAIIKAELYPTHVRALGVALPYAIAQAVFGGNAETVALYLKARGSEAVFFWIVAVALAIGFLVSVRMRDTRAHSRITD
jgi:MHS family alpha-ketoglutarate permease-like MFS transporter